MNKRTAAPKGRINEVVDNDVVRYVKWEIQGGKWLFGTIIGIDGKDLVVFCVDTITRRVPKKAITPWDGVTYPEDIVGK